MDKILLEDMEYIAGSKVVPWKCLEEKSVFITGATGLIGSQIVLALDKYNQLYHGRINIYAMVRNETKAKTLFGDCSSNVHLVIGDVNSEIHVNADIDYVIHGASFTSSKSFVDFPVETILTAIDGTNNLLKFAKDKKVQGFVYLSSLEAYGITDSGLSGVKESDYGYIDQLVPRSSYSEGKRMAECLCISYGHEYHIPVKIVRLAQTFGPGVSYTDNRVFAQFARCAIEQKDIVLKTAGETYRNYCYTRDAIIGIFCVLTKGNSNEAYNIANKATGISICDMAKMVSHVIAGDKIQVVFDIEEDISKLGYGSTIKILLDTTKIEEMGWSAEVDLEEAFRRMIESINSRKHL